MSSLNPEVSKPRSPVDAPQNVLSILDRLHALSLDQESKIDWTIYKIPEWSSKEHDFFRDKFIALEKDKAQFIYQLLRATGGTKVVEAGTSFGVSTIYLALAVGQNAREKGVDGVVIGTENEETKAQKAKEHWKECGDDVVGKYIDLRLGDIKETLKKDLPENIDLLLLDIWTPLALPALKLCRT